MKLIKAEIQPVDIAYERIEHDPLTILLTTRVGSITANPTGLATIAQATQNPFVFFVFDDQDRAVLRMDVQPVILKGIAALTRFRQEEQDDL